MLDITVETKDDSIANKYGMESGLACLASEKQMPIYDEIWGMKGRSSTPGGSAMNTARAANYFLQNR